MLRLPGFSALLVLALAGCGGDAFSPGNRAAVVLGDELEPIGDAAGDGFDDARELPDAAEHDATADARARDDARASADGAPDVSSGDAGGDASIHDAGVDVVEELAPLTPVCPYDSTCLNLITQASMPWPMCDDAGQCPASISGSPGTCCSAWGSQGTTAVNDQCLPTSNGPGGCH